LGAFTDFFGTRVLADVLGVRRPALVDFAVFDAFGFADFFFGTVFLLMLKI
jgi:hypothetical protein